MNLLNNYFLCLFFYKLNFFLLVLNLFFLIILNYFKKNQNYNFFFKNNSIYTKIKLFLKISFSLSLFFLLISFILYSNFLIFCFNNFLFKEIFLIPKLKISFNINFFFFFSNLKIFLSIDLFGFFILFLSYLVGFITFSTLDTRLYWNNIKYLYIFNLFVLIVFIFVSTTNLIIFFLFYEFLLLPSFLFVYFVSPSRRSIQASFYFLIWTQIGSFIVLFAISYIIIISGCYNFYSLKSFNFTQQEIFFIYFFIFLGFGIKVPIWPFHYWITKTHVEAPSGFSIYLSGFLVKSALYGFYKISNSIDFYFNSIFFCLICILGVIDASIKMWGQTDLKKLVAYCTIQEMNLIFFLFCFGDIFLKEIGFLFSLTHAFLSALMFFIVDCLYRRFHSRSILQINGISSFLPNLSVSIFFMCLFFAGLPGTLKFSIEFCLFNNFLDISLISCIILLISANFLGLVGFSKNWFNTLFGIKINIIHYMQFDLSKKETLIINFCFFILFFFSFLFNFIF